MIHLHIVLSHDAMEVAELPDFLRHVEATVPAAGIEGVVISGRMPIWAFAALTCLYHSRPWVATLEPRVDGGVVVASHDRIVAVGDIVHVPAGAIYYEVEF